MADIHFSLLTERLIIKPLALSDDRFIFELVNTEAWIRFIGNRNITSEAEAHPYIQKIIKSQDIAYWVVRQRTDEAKIGVITYIKRAYLEHSDIGFAFLPDYSEKGYAYEASSAVLDQLIQERQPTRILATTVPQNTRSIKLLNRLGFVFEREIEVANEKLHVYGRGPST